MGNYHKYYQTFQVAGVRERVNIHRDWVQILRCDPIPIFGQPHQQYPPPKKKRERKKSTLQENFCEEILLNALEKQYILPTLDYN